MKDAIDRMIGVVDETGAVISCSDLNRIGEVRDGVASDRLTAGESFVRDGYTYLSLIHIFAVLRSMAGADGLSVPDEAAEDEPPKPTLSL